MKNKKQVVSGLIMMLGPLVFLWQTGFKSDDLYLMAYISIGIMAISGAATLLKAIFGPAQVDAVDENQITPKELILATIFFLVGVFLMNLIGFYVIIFVMLFAIHCYLRYRNSQISIKHSLVFAVVAWTIVYLVFGVALDLRVPSNVLLF